MKYIGYLDSINFLFYEPYIPENVFESQSIFLRNVKIHDYWQLIKKEK